MQPPSPSCPVAPLSDEGTESRVSQGPRLDNQIDKNECIKVTLKTNKNLFKNITDEHDLLHKWFSNPNYLVTYVSLIWLSEMFTQLPSTCLKTG